MSFLHVLFICCMGVCAVSVHVGALRKHFPSAMWV